MIVPGAFAGKANNLRCPGQNSSANPSEGQIMRLTIGQLDSAEDALWQREALTASWDSEKSDLVIRGDMDNQALTAAAAGMMENRRLAFQIEDTGKARLVWRGYVNCADLLLLESDEVECCLTMFLDGWVGIVPLFSNS